MSKVLVIEDDAGILSSLSLYLRKSNYEPILCSNGFDAISLFNKHNPDIVILDINLPGRDWFEICELIRKKKNTPIIVLSARESETDKVAMLELGADDYVAKPFSPRELIARIHAVLKRSLSSDGILESWKPKFSLPDSGIIRFRTIKLDLSNFEAFVDEKPIRLTKTELLILALLIRNKNHAVRREVLMKEIIGYDNYVIDRTLDTHIKNLRKKLGNSVEIETVRGIGYKILAS